MYLLVRQLGQGLLKNPNATKSLILTELQSRLIFSSNYSCWNNNYNYRHLEMQAPLLKSSSKLKGVEEPRGMQAKYRYGMLIALISTSVAGDPTDPNNLGSPGEFKMTPDAEKWWKKGVENANRDLDQFDAIASALDSGSPDHSQLLVQLKLLQNVIDDVGNNNRQLIPKIVDVIHRINGFLEGDCPSIFSRAGLKALIWYVDGIRDNKSYYLLDGAQLWADLRIKVLEKYKSNPTVGALISDFESMQKETADLRDELDGFAQIFVKGIKKIHSMTGDIGSNLAELKKTAKELLDISVNSGPFLDHTKELEKNTLDLVAKYK